MNPAARSSSAPERPGAGRVTSISSAGLPGRDGGEQVGRRAVGQVEEREQRGLRRSGGLQRDRQALDRRAGDGVDTRGRTGAAAASRRAPASGVTTTNPNRRPRIRSANSANTRSAASGSAGADECRRVRERRAPGVQRGRRPHVEVAHEQFLHDPGDRHTDRSTSERGLWSTPRHATNRSASAVKNSWKWTGGFSTVTEPITTSPGACARSAATASGNPTVGVPTRSIARIRRAYEFASCSAAIFSAYTTYSALPCNA